MSKLAIGLAVVVLSACGLGSGNQAAASTPTPNQTSTAGQTPTATSGATPTPSASPGAGLTSQEAADQVAKDSGQACVANGSQVLVMGQGAAAYSYGGGPCGPGDHFIFIAYVDQDAAGWHPRNWTGTQCCSEPGATVPGSPFTFKLSRGCLNVHDAAGLAARVVKCVASGTQVETTGAPVYRDSHIWWRILTGNFSTGGATKEIGWADHDLLLCSNSPGGNASYC